MKANPDSKALSEASDLESLNALLDPISMRAGWNKHQPSLWSHPSTAFQPAMWTWNRAKAALDSAGRLINTELAERRNLFMVNPVEGNRYATLRTLVSAYQMIQPGEKARSHRHSPNALRLVLDVGDNCYTVVNGARIDMQRGDVVLTPGWAWHGHANDGSRKGYWIDFLDVPLVHLLEPMFLENWKDGFQVPDDKNAPPEYIFPWSNTQKRLAKAKSDASGRRRIELGSPALPTISVEVESLPAGLRTQSTKTTVSQVVAIIEGSGSVRIGESEFAWSAGDVLAIPSWNAFSYQVQEAAVLLIVSDRPVMEKLGFLRTES